MRIAYCIHYIDSAHIWCSQTTYQDETARRRRTCFRFQNTRIVSVNYVCEQSVLWGHCGNVIGFSRSRRVFRSQSRAIASATCAECDLVVAFLCYESYHICLKYYGITVFYGGALLRRFWVDVMWYLIVHSEREMEIKQLLTPPWKQFGREWYFFLYLLCVFTFIWKWMHNIYNM